MRRPAIGGLDHVRLKPACSATEASKSLVVVLVFSALPHILGHFGRGQLTKLHCSWASNLGSKLSAHSFANYWQLPFLNQQKVENGHRNFFMTKSQWKNVLLDMRIEPVTICIPGGHASDRATANLASLGIMLPKHRTAKALIRLCVCAGWSAPLLFQHGKMKLGNKYMLLDTPGILKYKQIYRRKYLQSVEWSKYLPYQPLFTRCRYL